MEAFFILLWIAVAVLSVIGLLWVIGVVFTLCCIVMATLRVNRTKRRLRYQYWAGKWSVK